MKINHIQIYYSEMQIIKAMKDTEQLLSKKE